MPTNTEAPPKPRSTEIRPELTRLPELTPQRLAFRRKFARLSRFLIRWLTRASYSGLENFPVSGPGVMVLNHLGDADIALILSGIDIQPDGLAKVELYDMPVVGWLLDRYGAIWVHRGTADRRAIRAAISALDEGRIVGIAPEGRQSLTGALEEATSGSAYIALKSGSPVIPIALTGTRNKDLFGSWLRLRRPILTLSVGEPFYLEDDPDRSAALANGTTRIMKTLAGLLPESYRGFYA